MQAGKCLCRERAKSKTPSKKRIMCIGMCAIDFVHVTDVPLDDDKKICDIDSYWQRGGNAMNICTVLRQLGAECEFLGVLTDETSWVFLLEDCHRRGIQIDNCPRIKKIPAFSSVVLVQSTGTRTIVSSIESYPALTYSQFKRVPDLCPYSWIHLEAREPAETLPIIKDILAYNQQNTAKIPISVDIDEGGTERIPLGEMADVVFLGQDFAQRQGWKNPQAAAFGLRHAFQPQPEANNIKPNIIVRWNDGAGCLDPEDNYQFIPSAQPEVVVDALGASDTFCGACIYALCIKRVKLSDAVDFGNEITGFKLGIRGYDQIKVT